MPNSSSISRRAQGVSAYADALLKSVEASASAGSKETQALTEEEAADAAAFLLMVADGLTEEDIRKRDPDLFRRVQERHMTQEEITQDRLDRLPYR